MLMNLVNNKPKTYTVYLFSVISLGIFLISVQAAVMKCSEWQGLIAGLLLMVLAVPLHLLARKRPSAYVFSFLLNFIACGFSVSAYYLTEKIPANLSVMFFSAIPAVIILLLVYLMLQIFPKKTAISAAAAANAVLLAAAAVLWAMTGRLSFSFGFFCLLISLFSVCVFGITNNHDEQPVLRNISYGSFGAFVIITAVVIVLITEGDVLDISDIFTGNDRKKKKQQ